MIHACFVHSLEKVFPDEAPEAVVESFSMLKNERYAVQLIVLCREEDTPVRITPPAFLREHIRVFTVGLIPVSATAREKCEDDFLLRGGTPTFCPDLLEPAALETRVRGGGYRALWLEIDGAGLDAGEYAADFIVELPEGRTTLSLAMTVIDACLPEQTLAVTHWFHADCLATRYGVEVFSEEHWTLLETYIRFAARHGMTMILTPLFTPPLDTEVGGERPTVQLVDVTAKDYTYTFSFERLERWIAVCERAGIRAFEIAPFFTQWGAKCAPKIMAHTSDGDRRIFGWETRADSTEYKVFLKALAAALNRFLAEKGIAERTWFHISDEPGEKDYLRYKKQSELLRSLFHGAGFLDALSEYRFYERGLTDVPVPCVDRLDSFAGRVPSLWTYYCCGPRGGNYVNRFFLFPSVRNRALGFGLYRYDCKGFLHWGYNFWYTELSKAPVDPFTDASAGGAFGDGDPFLVYPGADGEPLPSLRFKVFYDALQDERAMRLLESLVGRERALATLNELFADYRMDHYPKTPLAFAALREGINRAIADAL